MERITFYVDGFNFYYGLKASKIHDITWARYYWIDFVSLFRQFLGPEQKLERVIYFTAAPLDPIKSSRQSALLNANKLLHPEEFEVVRGKYINKNITCPLCNHSISRPEEKKTDVNISVRMIGDCVRDATDQLVLVSADSDLIPPIEFIQSYYPGKKVKFYFPPSRFSSDLRDNALHHRAKPILLEKNKQKFEKSRMEEVVSSEEKSYSKPTPWI